VKRRLSALAGGCHSAYWDPSRPMEQEVHLAWTPDVGNVVLISMLVFEVSVRGYASDCGRRYGDGAHAYATGLWSG
jgi:hypothetical protein